MQPTRPIRLQRSSRDAQKYYGEVVVKDAAYAHLGDIWQEVNVHGGLHLHLDAFRSGVRKRATTRESLNGFQTNLRHLLDSIVAILPKIRKRISQGDLPAARCVRQIVLEAVDQIDHLLIHSSSSAVACKNTLLAKITLSRMQKKVLSLSQQVEDRIGMIEMLLTEKVGKPTVSLSHGSEYSRRSHVSSDGLLRLYRQTMHQTAPEQHGVAPTKRPSELGSHGRTYEIRFKLVLALPNLKLSRGDLEAMLAILQEQAFHVWALFNALRIVCALQLAISAPTLFFYLRMLNHLLRLLKSGGTFAFYDASNTFGMLGMW